MERKTLTILFVALTFSLVCSASAKPADKFFAPDETYLFAKRDTCDLYMDIYNPAPKSETRFNGKEKPTVIFMFGGGFIRGTRNDESYHKWFRQMTDNGYRVVSNY